MACPCGSLSAYKNTFPDGRGGGKEVDAGSRSCVHTVLMLVLVCCLRLGTQRVDQGASVAVALLCLLAMASTVQGHNWAHSEFRARRKAQSKKVSRAWEHAHVGAGCLFSGVCMRLRE